MAHYGSPAPAPAPASHPPTRPVLGVVINADDLGIDPARDEGIFYLFEQGCVSQASLMVNGRSAATAVQRAVALNLPLGLHLDLTETPYCAVDHASVATLLCKDGHKLGKFGIRDAIKSNSILAQHIVNETKAQASRFRSLTGSGPTHLDGHNHVHVIPFVAEILCSILPEMGIVTVRIPDELRVLREVEADKAPEAPREFYQQVALEAVSARARFAAAGLVSTSSFIGLRYSGAAFSPVALLQDLAALAGVLGTRNHTGAVGESSNCSSDQSSDSSSSNTASTFSTVEIMCHPGYCGQGGDDFNRSLDRELELSALLCAPFRRLLEDGAIALTTFHDIAPAAAVCKLTTTAP
jgi:predicted glycoside hydrolase/deacetylase ChbG (UPF0249 family)